MTAKFFIITLILTYLTKKSSSWTITPSKNLITPAQLANRLDTSLRMSDTKEEAAKGPQIGEDGMVAPGDRPANPLSPLNELELSAQRTALSSLEEKWRIQREDEEYDAARLLGWTKQAEMYNGRFAMFFLVVGLLTEYWTGVTFPGQIEEMLRVGGFIELS
ncbi:hypothetical protein TrCOL_g4080 [Triparma columacea]|uniref:High light inducible protein n=1 Tax=Triparma columacea TaxID=722753 RepID=A0A9W7LC83_9STRA|nr:hypothetical protein TrCOL_g4080 [Triparma columacea]